MPLTRITSKGIADNAVTEDKITNSSVSADKLSANSVNSGKIVDGAVAAADLASTLDLSPKTVTLSASTVQSLKQPVQDNIALLGFKMAVNDGLTVFNLVDGIVDEFHDESGTDESEGSNDTYCATSDYYHNVTFTPVSVSAGFAVSSITEPDTSTAGTNPAQGTGTQGEFTVPTGMTSLTMYVWGSGGGSGQGPGPNWGNPGGGGGFSKGCLAVTAGQSLDIIAGEGGGTETVYAPQGSSSGVAGFYGGGDSGMGGGGGIAGVFVNSFDWCAAERSPGEAPDAYMIAGSGGGGGLNQSNPTAATGKGGGTSGGGGGSGTPGVSGGGGGSQTAGGSGGSGPLFSGQAGGLFDGGNSPRGGAGGAGYYGGGGGGGRPDGGGNDANGGGGSGYIAHPQITNGCTSGGGTGTPAAGSGDPNYPSIPYSASVGGEGLPDNGLGEDGYVLLTGSGCTSTPGASTTIVSTAFSASSVPTSSRIVVFEENVDTPTLNTDIIASVSRDGGSTYTNATLSDSGYVTGSSGQRILTGQATISGQPSGQSMRWKLALANNTVKIHGVALQWS